MMSAPRLAAMSAAAFVCGLAAPAFAFDAITLTVDCARGQSITQALKLADNLRRPLVLVVKGTCNENIKIDRDDVSLKGDPQAGGTINASSADSAITVSGAHRILIDRLNVRGGNPRGISLVGGSNVDISNSDIQSAVSHGINVQGTGAVNITNCSVQYAGRSGISITQGSVVISNSQITSNLGYGVRVQQRASVTVNNSNIASNAYSGFDVNMSQVTISGTSITGNGTDLTLAENQRQGVSALQSLVQIANSTVASNTGSGVGVALGSSLNLTSTSLTGNGGDGVVLYLAAVGNFAGNVNANGNAGSGLMVMVNSTAQLADGPLSFQNIWLGQASSLWVDPVIGIPITVPGGVGCADSKSSVTGVRASLAR